MKARYYYLRPFLIFLLILIILAGIGTFIYLRSVRDYAHIPTRGVMGFAFGVPIDYQSCGFHTGQDWFAPTGTPVYAIEDALVVYVGPLWVAGPGVGRGDKSIILYHQADDYYTTYGHNSAVFVNEGENVKRGKKIAEVGNEGYSGSPHLHFEKVVVPFTGNWQHPFVGCDGYVDPGNEWSPF